MRHRTEWDDTIIFLISRIFDWCLVPTVRVSPKPLDISLRHYLTSSLSHSVIISLRYLAYLTALSSIPRMSIYDTYPPGLTSSWWIMSFHAAPVMVFGSLKNKPINLMNIREVIEFMIHNGISSVVPSGRTHTLTKNNHSMTLWCHPFNDANE